jgi:hypothetical protein
MSGCSAGGSVTSRVTTIASSSGDELEVVDKGSCDMAPCCAYSKVVVQDKGEELT